jgi:hypothetical protein
MGKNYEVEELVDSLATISDIIFKRLHCMECNQCEPCGAVFMKALNNLRQAGHIEGIGKERVAGEGAKNS